MPYFAQRRFKKKKKVNTTGVNGHQIIKLLQPLQVKAKKKSARRKQIICPLHRSLKRLIARMLSKSLPTFTILPLVSRYRERRRIILHRAIFQWDIGDIPCPCNKYSWVIAGKVFRFPSTTLPIFPSAATPPYAATRDEGKDYHGSQKNVRQTTKDFFLQFFSFLAR